MIILLESIFKICDAIDAKCQLQEGSLLGAVKLSNILPWERDADIAILSSDFEKLIHYLKDNTIGKLKLRNKSFFLSPFLKSLNLFSIFSDFTLP